MWRGKELVGIVMAVPNIRHGAFGSAHRRIAGNEMMYRIKVVRYVTGEYQKFSDRVETRGLFGGIPKGGGVKIVDSSEAVIDPETGEAVKAKLVEEKSRAWRLDKEIENLELERQRAKSEYDSEVSERLTCLPISRPRHHPNPFSQFVASLIAGGEPRGQVKGRELGPFPCQHAC